MSLWDKYKMKFAFVYIFAVLLISVAFTGCKTDEVLQDAPINHVYTMDLKSGICSRFIITDKRTLSAKRDAEFPIAFCDGFVAISAQTWLDTKTYIKKLQGIKVQEQSYLTNEPLAFDELDSELLMKNH